MPKPNLLYKVFKSSWMLDPMTAAAAYKVYSDMKGAAALKSKYPIIEYEAVDDNGDTYENTYYHYRLTHKDYPSIPDGKQISVIRLEGVMMRDEGWCQPGTRDLAEWMKQGDADQRVVATILLVDSGGGAADAVKPLADAITECTKPVLAFCDGDMCSAAYYVSVYASHIMAAENRNRIGCIGTMIQLSSYPSKATDEDGYVHLRIYADNSDEKNAEFEKALEGDFKLIKENILNPLAEDFRSAVKKKRSASTEDQRHGRTYYAQDVVGTLIDSIGDFKGAVRQALNLTNLTITEMKGNVNLQSLDSCRDLQMVDGYVSLNVEQLGEIDQAIGETQVLKASNETQANTIAEQAETINELTQERDELRTKAEQCEAKDAEIAELTKERDRLQEEAANKDNRIKELEDLLAEAPEDEEAMTAMHNGNPAKEDTFNEPTDEESMEYCREVLKH